MADVSLVQKSHINELTDAGDYCFVPAHHYSPECVVMNCPSCGAMFVCHHAIEQREPLTLSPSVVGAGYSRASASQVMTPCHHHFWVKNGKAVNIA